MPRRNAAALRARSPHRSGTRGKHRTRRPAYKRDNRPRTDWDSDWD